MRTPLSPRNSYKKYSAAVNRSTATRRATLSAAAFVATATLLAGCASVDSSSGDNSPTEGTDTAESSAQQEQESHQPAPQFRVSTVDLGSIQAAVPGFGGLSGLEQVEPGQFVAISDDKGDYGPTRAYTLDITANSGTVDDSADSDSADNAEPQVTETIEFTDSSGHPLDPVHVDAEEIRILPQPGDADPHFLYTSEGDPEAANYGSPSIVETDRTGKELRRIEPPLHHLSDEQGNRGVRANKGPEGMAVAPDGSYFVTINENALVQDGPENDQERGSRSRMTFYDTATGEVLHEYAVDIGSVYPGAKDRGISSLDFDANGNLYALERGFIPGAGNPSEIYRLDVSGATDVKDIPALDGTETPVGKTQVVDLAEVFENIRDIDNVEGLDVTAPQDGTPQGQTLAPGTTFTLVTDNNFSDKQRSLLHTIEVI